jgi:hypothetical protein
LAERGILPIIPPQPNAKINQHGNSGDAPLPRDEAIREIRRVGRKEWKEEIGYHRRSLVETAMHRLKTSFGGVLKKGYSRTSELRRGYVAKYSIVSPTSECQNSNGISQQGRLIYRNQDRTWMEQVRPGGATALQLKKVNDRPAAWSPLPSHGRG